MSAHVPLLERYISTLIRVLDEALHGFVASVQCSATFAYSDGADKETSKARELGIPIFFSHIDELKASIPIDSDAPQEYT